MIPAERNKIVQALANLDELTDIVKREGLTWKEIEKSLAKTYFLLNSLIREDVNSENKGR